MATKLGSYAGKVLKIDLTTKTVSEYPFSDKQRELFLGGKIMAAKIIYDNVKRKIDAYDPENMLIVSSCPLNGSGCPSSSRFNVSAISPLTGLLSSSNCGGSFGIFLKFAGIDALIITGKSDEKTLIKIVGDNVTFENADELWGLKTADVQEKIGGKSGKLVIGPAGENLVRYACIVSGERAAGRGGLGAVMGSKGIKAITVSGTTPPKVADKESLSELNKKWVEILKKHPLTGQQLPKLGTAGLLTSMQMNGILATKNFESGLFDNFEKISGEVLAEKYLVGNSGCMTCPIQCARVVMHGDKKIKGPEVEIMGLLGANILNDDLGKIIEWNYLLDEYGMDTISAAGTISFAMELKEKGLWDNPLEFGKTDNISELIKEIATRSSEVGNILAEGSKRMSAMFGGKEFCIQSKGMELSAYEPRGVHGQGLGYAIANRGGCHLNAGYLTVMEVLGLGMNPYTHKGKASLTMTFQNLMEAVSAGGSCFFTTYAFLPSYLLTHPNSLITRIVNKALPHVGGLLYLANKAPWILSLNLTSMLPHPVAIKHATGIKLNFGKMLRIGERGYNLERIVNQRMGCSGKDDALPARLTKTLADPNNPKSVVPLAKMKKRYYKCRGWSQTGYVPRKMIEKLKLEG